MPNELNGRDTRELSPQEMDMIDNQVSALIKNLENHQAINREEIDSLVREGMLALTSSNKMVQEKSKQEFFAPDELIKKFENKGFKFVKRKDYLLGVISCQIVLKS